jgi:hypothetical protein
MDDTKARRFASRVWEILNGAIFVVFHGREVRIFFREDSAREYANRVGSHPPYRVTLGESL